MAYGHKGVVTEDCAVTRPLPDRPEGGLTGATILFQGQGRSPVLWHTNPPTGPRQEETVGRTREKGEIAYKVVCKDASEKIRKKS